jgi:hypothetical protein
VRTTSLYLFKCRDTERYAVSVDKTGVNIPPTPAHPHWFLRGHLSTTQFADAHTRELEEAVQRGFAVLEGRPLVKKRI